MKKTLFLIVTLFVILLTITCLWGCATTKPKSQPPAVASHEPVKQETPADPGVVLLFDETTIIKDTENKPFPNVSVIETVKNMTVGWNLGNTLDATGSGNIYSETTWGQPLTTKEMIDYLAESGIKTIRIPISWAKHMDKTTYTVNQEWMARVKEIVDWAIDDDMYVIINSHHDNWLSTSKIPACNGYYPNEKNKIESERFLYNLWTQIALAFNNGYDEHLIFETMNEPRLAGTNHEWWFDGNAADCKDAAKCLNEYNQIVVDAVRATGGNNQKRFIMCTPLQASPESAFSPAFVMPTDDEPGKLIVSIHAYRPYNFAMVSPGDVNFTNMHIVELGKLFKSLYTRFIAKGYPVVIGEYGATNKNNLEDRIKWMNFFITESRKYGITSCLWDNGAWEVKNNDYNEKFGYYNRRELNWFFPEITDTMIKAANETK